MNTLADNLKEIREANRLKKDKYILNWRENLPEGSQWFPGSTGLPTCQLCNGLGWLRQDLPVGHPEFGKLVKCDCVR